MAVTSNVGGETLKYFDGMWHIQTNGEWEEAPLMDFRDKATKELESEICNLRELLAEAYAELSGKISHASDCAVSQAPAMTPGRCNCDSPDKPSKSIAVNIVFEATLSSTLRFVEVENDDGESMNIGKWIERDGYSVLRIEKLPETE